MIKYHKNLTLRGYKALIFRYRIILTRIISIIWFTIHIVRYEMIVIRNGTYCAVVLRSVIITFYRVYRTIQKLTGHIFKVSRVREALFIRLNKTDCFNVFLQKKKFPLHFLTWYRNPNPIQLSFFKSFTKLSFFIFFEFLCYLEIIFFYLLNFFQNELFDLKCQFIHI